MLKSECFVGQIVHFTCNGRDAQGSRGGHYGVKGVVTKVKQKNALITEVKGTYRPGALWDWPIEKLRTEEQDKAHGREMLAELAKLPHLAGIIKELQK